MDIQQRMDSQRRERKEQRASAAQQHEAAQQKKPITCSRCGRPGHNRRTCGGKRAEAIKEADKSKVPPASPLPTKTITITITEQAASNYNELMDWLPDAIPFIPQGLKDMHAAIRGALK